MKTLVICGLVFLSLVVPTSSVLGDLAPAPPPEPLQQVSGAAPMVVSVDRYTKNSRLVIPKKYLRNARGAASLGRILTAFAALALTVAGAFYLKPDGKKWLNPKVCSGVGITLGVAVALWSALPLGSLKPQEHYEGGTIDVEVEVVPHGEHVKLIVHHRERRYLPHRY